MGGYAKNNYHKDNNILSSDAIERNTRNLFLDIARTIAILLVVFCHATECFYKMDLTEWNVISFQSKMIRTIYFTIGRLGVPLFLFLSGILLLSKKIDNTEDCLKFYKKNLLPLVITTEIWNIIYNIFIVVFYKKSFDIIVFIENLLFLKKVDMPNMWYMPMIIGMYLAIPFLAIIVKKIDFKTIKIPMIISIIALMIVPIIKDICLIKFKLDFKSVLDLSFLGGVYGLYILVGYYLGKGKLKKTNGIALGLICIISFTLTCYYQIWRYNVGMAYNVWYDFPGLMIASICLFELLSRKKYSFNSYLEKIITFISKASLAIFFIHIIVQNVLKRLIDFSTIKNSVSVLIMSILVFITTTIIIMLLSKIKIIRNKVLLIK